MKRLKAIKARWYLIFTIVVLLLIGFFVPVESYTPPHMACHDFYESVNGKKSKMTIIRLHKILGGDSIDRDQIDNSRNNIIGCPGDVTYKLYIL